MKTSHRIEAQHKQHNRQYADQLPKFWRPKLKSSQCLDAKVIHWDLITRFSSGTATSDDLWDWLETGYTYVRIMQLQIEDGREFTPEAVGAMSDQIDIYASVIDRFRRTGRVGFSGTELLTARSAACIMDGLIEIDRHGIALRAGHWAVEQMNKIRALSGIAMRRAA